MIEIFYTKIIKLKARNCRVSIFFRSFQYNSNGDYFVTQNGDSGGGWSYGNYAMGVQTGHDSSGMFFTDINRALNAIDGELY